MDVAHAGDAHDLYAEFVSSNLGRAAWNDWALCRPSLARRPRALLVAPRASGYARRQDDHRPLRASERAPQSIGIARGLHCLNDRLNVPTGDPGRGVPPSPDRPSGRQRADGMLSSIIGSATCPCRHDPVGSAARSSSRKTGPSGTGPHPPDRSRRQSDADRAPAALRDEAVSGAFLGQERRRSPRWPARDREYRSVSDRIGDSSGVSRGNPKT